MTPHKHILNFIILGIRDNIDVIRGKVKNKHISTTTMKWLVWHFSLALMELKDSKRMPSKVQLFSI